MRGTNNTIKVFSCSAALVASLGLFACGAKPAAETTTEAPQESTTTTEASAKDVTSTVTKYGFTKLLCGMGDNDESMAYLFEDASEQKGAFLVYYTTDNAYEKWVGTLTKPAENQLQITDDESGESITLTITETDSDGTLTIERPDGKVSRITPTDMEYAGDVLDTISNFAGKVGEAAPPSASDIYDYLIRIHTEGMGQISYTQSTFPDGGPSLDDFADDVATHANKGDTLTFLAKPDEGHQFLKWTKDGSDFSTDAQIEVVADGDAEYSAVFDY